MIRIVPRKYSTYTVMILTGKFTEAHIKRYLKKNGKLGTLKIFKALEMRRIMDGYLFMYPPQLTDEQRKKIDNCNGFYWEGYQVHENVTYSEIQYLCNETH